MTAPINQVSEANRRTLAMQKLAQDYAADPEAMGPATETNDMGRDLEHFPHGWWLPWVIMGGMAVTLLIVVVTVANLLGPRY